MQTKEVLGKLQDIASQLWLKHSKALWIAAVLSVTFIACKRETILTTNETVHSVSSADNALEASGNSASAHIAASENLIIPAAVAVPTNLPGGNTRVATYYAVGVQKYKARIKAGSDPVLYEWAFVAPQADLYDITNAKLGTHGAGPFWEISPADSIFAQQFSPARTAPSSDPESIDWLLLMPKVGTTATGIFADVDYIQRIATKGGKAPLTPPTSLTQTVEVKYKTVYRFTKIN